MSHPHSEQRVDLVEPPRTRRPVWRQKLVAAERGLVGGMRGDSAFFSHFFGISIAIASGVVLGISFVEWIVFGFSIMVVLVTELLHQAFRALTQDPDHPATPAQERAAGIASGAVLISFIGSVLMIGLILGNRILQLL